MVFDARFQAEPELALSVSLCGLGFPYSVVAISLPLHPSFEAMTKNLPKFRKQGNRLGHSMVLPEILLSPFLKNIVYHSSTS